MLEAINKYRGALPVLTLDSGLNKAAEEVAKVILSNKPLGEGEDAFAEAHKAILGYKNAELYQPIGLSMNEVSEGTYKAAPRYVCQDDAKLMGEQLMAQTGDPALEQLKSPSSRWWASMCSSTAVQPTGSQSLPREGRPPEHSGPADTDTPFCPGHTPPVSGAL